MEENTEEKLEFLKREEIKTMQKDIAKLREKEAKKEKKRISDLKTEEEAIIEKEKIERIKREAEEREKLKEELEKKIEIPKEKLEKPTIAVPPLPKKNSKIFEIVGEKTKEIWKKEEKERERFLERVQEKELEEKQKSSIPTPEVPISEVPVSEVPVPEVPVSEIPKIPEVPKIEEKESLIPKLLPKKPSRFEKVFIRAVLVIVLVLVFVNLFFFWYWYLRVQPILEETQILKETFLPEQTIPEVIAPPSLISIDKIVNLEVSNLEEIPSLLLSFFEQDLEKNQFAQIMIKDLNENKFLGLKEFFKIFNVETSETLLDKLDNDFTLFIYSQEQGNRLGFVAEIKEKESLIEILNSWEDSMEKDFENVFSLMEKESPALVSYFKEGDYEGIDVRFQTFSKEDLGICYSIFDNFFLFTSSWESLGKTINKLSESH
ncbi:hypothetical protein ACFL0A_00080 [Patescibacteria group bacterium]